MICITPGRAVPTSAVLLVVQCLVAVTPCHADGSIEFNRDIRPILTAACLSCHGPDSASRQADLRFDQRDVAIELGAIVPGDPDSSEMIRRILSDDEAEQMPPPESKKTLSDFQKQMLADWIREGADYQPHWSLIPPVRPTVPSVKNSQWCRNPIDNFVAHRLEAAGLQPSPEADRRTIARRVSLDLTGLPPTAETVETFVNDTSPDAYERLVDGLLDSLQWGEHRGRYWLDAARYADTHGMHFDNFREMWSYRDWVINAFNRNLPFDEFTIDNLAGDLLPAATLEQQVGSGFNRCNITTNEDGSIPDEVEVLYTRDRVETTCQVWMGLTAGCAVCHDHKFDPLSQREFYEMAAFFNNTTQSSMDGNVKDTAPVVVVPSQPDKQRWQELSAEVVAVDNRLEEHREIARQEFEAWLAVAKPEDVAIAPPTTDLDLHVPFDDGDDSIRYVLHGQVANAERPNNVEWKRGRGQAHSALLKGGTVLSLDNVGDYDSNQPFSFAAWVKIPTSRGSDYLLAHMYGIQAHRGWDLWVENGKIGTHLIERWPRNAIKVMSREQVAANDWVHVAVVYDGSSKAAGIDLYLDGILREVDVTADSLTGSIRAQVPFKIGQRGDSSRLSGTQIQDVRLYSRQLEAVEVASLAGVSISDVVTTSPDQQSRNNLETAYSWWLMNVDLEFQSLWQRRQQIDRQQREIRSRGTVGYVMHDRDEAPVAYVLNRGEYDQRCEKVGPDTPAMLPDFPEELPRNRLGFARWLLRPEHPLTARVAVNRFWSEVFGAGLVKTSGDFGVAGEAPSHPELLDWLAVEFRESNWDVKHLFKLMVTSATYRQSNVTTAEMLETDPDNRLFSRGPRFRMDAEMVRDYALAASGLLSSRIGGPSVKPYQPPGVWEAVAMSRSNTRQYKPDTGESLYRRSLYTFWKRSAPPASMEIFNAPNREHCVVVRDRTNTPLQALATLNDTQFVEAARNLAEQAVLKTPLVDDRLEFMSKRLVARPLARQEMQILKSCLVKFSRHYQSNPKAARELVSAGESRPSENVSSVELAAWTMIANQLMNLDEVLNK